MMIRNAPDGSGNCGPRFEQRASAFDFRAINRETGEFSGWACIFGVLDDYGTVWDRGCFVETLAEWRQRDALPHMLYFHNWREPIGRWLKMEERDKGLWVEGRLELRTQRGQEIAALIAAEPHPAIDALSVGFRPIEAEYDASRALHFKRVHLGEVSLLTLGGVPGAQIERRWDVDSIRTERDFEQFLREAGLSRSEALALASRFKPKADAPRDAAPADIGPFRALLDDIRRASSH